MSKSRKAFTIIETLVAISLLAIMISGVMMSFSPFMKEYFRSENNMDGELYQMAYDIQQNKMYAKRIVVSDDKTQLKLYRSPSCFSSYKFYPDSKELAKLVACTPEENIIEADNVIIIPNIKNAKFEKAWNTVYLDLNTTYQNYTHTFAF